MILTFKSGMFLRDFHVTASIFLILKIKKFMTQKKTVFSNCVLKNLKN